VPAVATNATANGYHDRWKKMLRNTRFRVLSSLASQKARCAKMLAGKKLRNIHVISGRGLIYSVEEVSDLLGIPRPTLYRYLREYSIPHLRKSGKISIPEESFDRIREARDLHKEGLGTESVRRTLREGSTDTGEIKERIERLSESLESLRGNGSAADEALSSRAMRTVLARQSLMMSAMFNLTEMVEELLLASGKPRKTVFEEVDHEIWEVPPLADRSDTQGAVPATRRSPRGLPGSTAPPASSERFGSLGRRRRRMSLALLLTLVVAATLLLALPTTGGEQAAGFPFPGDRASETPPSAPAAGPEKQPAGRTESGGVAAGSSSANDGATADTAASGEVDTGPGEVPDVSGRSVDQAAKALSRAGYEVAAIQTVKSEEEAETAVGTEPSVGTPVGPGSPVVLRMSGGPSGKEARP
jgi:excisionase family DNA binding protein